MFWACYAKKRLLGRWPAHVLPKLNNLCLGTDIDENLKVQKYLAKILIQSSLQSTTLQFVLKYYTIGEYLH